MNLYGDKYALLDEFRAFSLIDLKYRNIDPIYEVISKSTMSSKDKKRFILSSLLNHDVRQSIILASEENDKSYYDLLKKQYEEGKVAKERKDVASRETNSKSRTYGTQIPLLRMKKPEEWVDLVIDRVIKTKSWGESMKVAKLIPTFGEYFAFKVSDMVESVFNIDSYEVVWDDWFRKSLPKGALTGFETVLTGKKLIQRQISEIRLDMNLINFFDNELKYFSSFVCPHNENRMIGVGEIETFLCDFRKHKKGTFLHGGKVEKIIEGLDKSSSCRIHKDLLNGATNLIYNYNTLKGEL